MVPHAIHVALQQSVGGRDLVAPGDRACICFADFRWCTLVSIGGACIDAPWLIVGWNLWRDLQKNLHRSCKVYVVTDDGWSCECHVLSIA
jgi:hypothetical protein